MLKKDRRKIAREKRAKSPNSVKSATIKHHETPAQRKERRIAEFAAKEKNTEKSILQNIKIQQQIETIFKNFFQSNKRESTKDLKEKKETKEKKEKKDRRKIAREKRAKSTNSVKCATIKHHETPAQRKERRAAERASTVSNEAFATDYYQEPVFTEEEKRIIADYKVIEEANKRYDALKQKGIDSFAIRHADYEGGKFTMYYTDEYQRNIELTRARTFLADITSTPEGAEEFEARMLGSEYKALFGKGYHERVSWQRTMNTLYPGEYIQVDESAASRAFEAYRRLEEERANEIVGAGGYGSTNLISYLYSVAINNGDSLMAGKEILDNRLKLRGLEYLNWFDEADWF